MGFLHNSPMGQPSGKVGDIVFRRVNGKIVIARAPKKGKTSVSDTALRIRSNFAAGAKFASFISSIPGLKSIWLTQKKKGGSANNIISKLNIPHLKEGDFTPGNIITPDGIPLTVDSILISNKDLEGLITFLYDAEIIFPAVLYIVIIFNNYFTPFHMLCVQINEPSEDKTYSFKLDLDYLTQTAVKKDPAPMVYVALAGSASVDKKIYWTSTVALQLHPDVAQVSTLRKQKHECSVYRRGEGR